MAEPVLRVADLSHKYTKNWAIEDISFEINGSGITGLLGSNGAGKSTLMNIVCGCLSQTRGSVFVEGIDGREKPLELRSKIGFLPQQAPLSLELTIEEYLRFCAAARGMKPKPAREAVDAVMERCGLTTMRSRLISNLSGGYRQRTGIAQAVVHRPKLIILDEPTVGLDPNQLQGVRDLILDIGREHTVVFSTHILPEVEAMCREIVMVESGSIVFHNDLRTFQSVVESNAIILVAQNLPSARSIRSLHSDIEMVDEIGPQKVRIQHSAGRGFVSTIIGIGQQNDWTIEEIFFERSSLEDVFTKLSSGAVS